MTPWLPFRPAYMPHALLNRDGGGNCNLVEQQLSNLWAAATAPTRSHTTVWPPAQETENSRSLWPTNEARTRVAWFAGFVLPLALLFTCNPASVAAAEFELPSRESSSSSSSSSGNVAASGYIVGGGGFVVAEGGASGGASQGEEGMDALTRELLERTERNRAANNKALLLRTSAGQLPFAAQNQRPTASGNKEGGGNSQRSDRDSSTLVVKRSLSTDSSGGAGGSGGAAMSSSSLDEKGAARTAETAAEAAAAAAAAAARATGESSSGSSGVAEEGTNPLSVKKRDNGAAQTDFHTRAFGNEEYNNAFSASDNTNVSPKEAYDTILAKMAPSKAGTGSGGKFQKRALDLGAGAGVSTEMLWRLGYKDVVAVDWSDAAWNQWVETVPPNGGVRFFALDDQRFLDAWTAQSAKATTSKEQRGALAGAASGADTGPAEATSTSSSSREGLSESDKFDAIVFNYAVNSGKASFYAKNLLRAGGLLLAPVNKQDDYWLKQEYRVLNEDAAIVWRAGEVGAWDVVFQPDMTEESCRGVRWCPETDKRSTQAEAEFTRPTKLTYKQQ
eukprot:CAMPEP_0171990820 /NCGR_PEP_ID=MMETSP0993-20121228/277116_1 /TAXON_ID=483369 /ORGANISM="non described non described, Strain CCMP2098" /LENGTH=560 /DNA_ID=CAMNT_0012643835 /DNA_START=28 /DNA_END=1709 /DNA_ORIENTATION=-